jgi:hypothetical protein
MPNVVAQLLDVRERLAAAAVTAMRAKADADQVHEQYAEAAQGTEHPQIQEALTDIRAASEKAVRTARLLTEARAHFTAYLNKIAPGSASGSDVLEAGLPSGEELISEAESRAESSSDIGAFLRRTSRNIESIQDTGKTVTEAAQNTVNIIRKPFKPPGSQTTTTGTGSPVQPSILQRIDAPEAVGHLLVVGVIAGVSLHKSSQLLRKSIERFRSRGNKKRTQRPHPSDSEA